MMGAVLMNTCKWDHDLQIAALRGLRWAGTAPTCRLALIRGA